MDPYLRAGYRPVRVPVRPVELRKRHEKPPVPQHWTGDHGRPHRRFRGSRIRPAHYLRGRRGRRYFQDGQRRADVAGHFRRSAQPVHRRPGPGAFQSLDSLRGHRRAQQPAECLVGQRSLQVDGCRRHLHPHGTGRDASHRPHRGAPHQSRHRVCGGAGRSVGPEQRARRLHEHRWRRALESDSLRQ